MVENDKQQNHMNSFIFQQSQISPTNQGQGFQNIQNSSTQDQQILDQMQNNQNNEFNANTQNQNKFFFAGNKSEKSLSNPIIKLREVIIMIIYLILGLRY